MGSSAKVYVGPYFRCFAPLVDKMYDVHHACTNTSCKNYGKDVHGQFCSKCGTKSGTVQRKTNGAAVTTGQVRSAMPNEDSLTDLTNGSGPIVTDKKGVIHLWAGNAWPQGCKPPRRFYINLDDSGEHQLQPADVSEDKEFFQGAFQKEHAILEHLYGKENVQVCWGVINYWY